MKKFIYVLAVIILFAAPASSYAIGIEGGVGVWSQEPSGEASYKDGYKIDVVDDAKLEKETRGYGRVKADMPLIIPNVYLVYTPMSFSGSGKISKSFEFGNTTYDANAKFDTDLTLDSTDLALYYGIPFLNTATLGVLNAEVGLNVRYVDFSLEVKGSAGGMSKTESQSDQIYIPMAYAAVQITPTDSIAVEAEYRGISFSGNQYSDLIGRLKVKPFGPLFLAAGYRQQSLDIDESDVKLEMGFKGPFIEAGLQF